MGAKSIFFLNRCRKHLPAQGDGQPDSHANSVVSASHVRTIPHVRSEVLLHVYVSCATSCDVLGMGRSGHFNEGCSGRVHTVRTDDHRGMCQTPVWSLVRLLQVR